ncbi:MAG: VWA domain-containing protein [Alphaproteobacteria bacterium]|nr:VWA domain-containing protein [Alphaproteobacteria bacterium]
MAKLPKTSSETDVSEFLNKVAATTAPKPAGARGRLIFAMDATASREPTWDRACHIQAEMFSETSTLGGLEVQLLYYRGFGECRASRWAGNSAELLRFMTSVRCLGGQTQIEKVLKHVIRESRKKKVDAVVFVGDAMEEDIDRLCHQAGELGLLGVPVFVFHEGGDPLVRNAFQQIARLSGGAYCAFDSGSAKQLRDLLSAVAVYAAGGRRALLEFGDKRGGDVLRLTHQMGGKP